MALRVVRTHGRLFTSIAIGIALFFVLPASERLVVRVLIGWDVGVGVYLVLAFVMTFFIKEVPLRALGGAAAARAESGGMASYADADDEAEVEIDTAKNETLVL